jgi:hypothetical protein
MSTTNGGHTQWRNPYPKGSEDTDLEEWDRLEKSFKALDLLDVFRALTPHEASFVKLSTKSPK